MRNALVWRRSRSLCPSEGSYARRAGMMPWRPARSSDACRVTRSNHTQAIWSANLDVVRSVYAAWERCDFSSDEWADPEIEFAFAGGPEPESWTGPAAMADGYRDWVRARIERHAEPEEYLVIDNERILVLVRSSARARIGGQEIEERSLANLFDFHQGKVRRIVVYPDRELAFDDLGLGPEVGRPWE